MANFYTDIPELKYHLINPMMEEWTKKVLTAETDVWNMLQEPNKTWMRWSKPD